MPAVSVIIPSYNLGQYIGETLQSVKDQTFQDWECLVVENGSEDNSKEVIREFVSLDPRFKLIPLLSNVGVAAARNMAMQRCFGKYLVFLDADDLMDPRYMEQAVAALEEDPSLVEDPGYLQSLSEKVSVSNSYIIVRKGEDIYYTGNEAAAEPRKARPPLAADVPLTFQHFLNFAQL